MPLILPLALAGVLLFTAVRRIGRLRLPIWLVMLAGAAAVLLSGSIRPADALRAVDLDVMLFLFGMFVVGRAMEESGYLASLSYRLFRRARSAGGLVLAVLLAMGAAAALLMNDTVAIVGTPVMILLARSHGLRVRMLLHALALAVTTGSAVSPIGNPQNLLIALDGRMANPFLTFGRFLLLPTAINLLMAFATLAGPAPASAYPAGFRPGGLNHREQPLADPALAALAAGSTISGNLLLLGAASNVIIVQNAEARAGETFTYWQFARIGLPLTLLQTAVYWLFLLPAV